MSKGLDFNKPKWKVVGEFEGLGSDSLRGSSLQEDNQNDMESKKLEVEKFSCQNFDSRL